MHSTDLAVSASQYAPVAAFVAALKVRASAPSRDPTPDRHSLCPAP